eukprot:3108619-Rhodomonas_salina.1
MACVAPLRVPWTLRFLLYWYSFAGNESGSLANSFRGFANRFRGVAKRFGGGAKRFGGGAKRFGR